MEMREPESRYVTKAATDSLTAKFGWSHEDWMQDWPLEISNEILLDDCLREYDGLTDDDEKFLLMTAMLYALDEKNEEEAGLYTDRISKFLNRDFDIHKHTIYYWALYSNLEPEDEFRMASFLRGVWNNNHRLSDI